MKTEVVIQKFRKAVGESIDDLLEQLAKLEDGSEEASHTIHSMTRLMHYRDALDFVIGNTSNTRFAEVVKVSGEV